MPTSAAAGTTNKWRASPWLVSVQRLDPSLMSDCWWRPSDNNNWHIGCGVADLMCNHLPGICDQLTTLGVEFSPKRLNDIFIEALRYGAKHPYPMVPKEYLLMPSWVQRIRAPLPWARTPRPCPPVKHLQHTDPINCTMKDAHPKGTPQQLWAYGGRAWGLGQIRYPDSWLTVAAGTIVRRPGCFMRVDEDNNADTDSPLLNTNERIHSSARIRLACGGLGLDDRQTWTCPSLLQDDSRQANRSLWRLQRTQGAVEPEGTAKDADFWRRELAQNEDVYEAEKMYNVQQDDGKWQWVLEKGALVKNAEGKDVTRSIERPVLPEEPMVGYWEKVLLALMTGASDVWRLAEEHVSWPV